MFTKETKKEHNHGFDTLNVVIIIGCLGIVANLFAIVVICSYRKMRKRPVSQLIVSQSAVDLVTSVFLVVYHILFIQWHFKSPHTGLAGQLYCKLWFNGIWHWGFMMSSTYNLLAVTLERYLMIVYPMYHKNAFTVKKTTALIVITWFIGPVFKIAWAVPSSGIRDTFCLPYALWPSDLIASVYGITSVTVDFFLPTILLTYMYARMTLVLGRRANLGQVAPLGEIGPLTAAQRNKARAQRNVVKTLVIVVACFILCSISNAVFYTIYNIWEVEIATDLHFSTVVLVYINTCINPFVYIFQFKDFQAAMKSLFRCTTRVKIGQAASSNTETST